MRRLMTTLLIAGALATPAVAQSAQAMIDAYLRLETYAGRQKAMVAIADLSSPELKDFFVADFRRTLMVRERSLSKQEEAARIELGQILLNQLGTLKVREAAAMVHRFYVEEHSYLLKGAALETLGRMGATEFLPFVVGVLNVLNTTPMNVDYEEKAVLGAILALESFADPSGYEPVFYASIGRYSAPIRARAAQSLPSIAPDPTAVIATMLEGELSRSDRYHALKVLADSDAPRESKIAIATRALERTLEEAVRNMLVEERKSRIQLRAEGLEILITYEAQNPEAVKTLVELAQNADEINNRLLALSALGVNATEEAAAWLAEYLGELNTRQELGDAKTDPRVVRATIRAAADTGDPVVSSELFRVKFSGYANGVVREADMALEKMAAGEKAKTNSGVKLIEGRR